MMIVEEKSCVGCKACADICPKDAILFEVNYEGFWYPQIDESKCIECGACKRVCPAVDTHMASADNRMEPETYKVYHKDLDIRYNSTSGGLYSLVAEQFIKDGGYIVGCSYADDFNSARHIVGNTHKDLLKIRRSKYFQSDTEGIYKKVKELLIAGHKVLFSGSPCQVSALYGFLGKEYENIYTIDYICRGINSPLAYKAYIDELRSVYHSEIEEVHFKNKSRGWTNLGTYVKFTNGKEYYRNRDNDPWVSAYIRGNLYMRYCCENCKYKGFPRVADISMGDFWGLEFTEEERKLGVSVAFVNTEKGDTLLKATKDQAYLEQREFAEAVNGNPALVSCPIFNPKRKDFFERIQSEPYSKVVWSLLEENQVKRVLKRVKSTIKAILKNAMKEA